MRDPRRIQGRVPNTYRELRRGITIRQTASAGTASVTKLVAVLTTPDWHADGAMYYADVTHSLRSVAYHYQITDNMTGEDILPERVSRTLDLDKLRIWLSYVPASTTVIIV